LEMAAILCNIQAGDEVIVPSYTFVSTTLAFIRQGAKIVFADSYENHPNIDPNKIEQLITDRTKVIVPVHYAGMGCDMDKIMSLTDKYNLLLLKMLFTIDSYYISPNTGIKKALGAIGHFGCFSFHETKNIISGEGGMLAVNDERFFHRAEIIWEKGTNRAEFFRGEVNKYEWVDIGSCFLSCEIIATFLWAQIENIYIIQNRRRELWNTYYENFQVLEKKKQVKLPIIQKYATNNAHMFYLICQSLDVRTRLINSLKEKSSIGCVSLSAAS